MIQNKILLHDFRHVPNDVIINKSRVKSYIYETIKGRLTYIVTTAETIEDKGNAKRPTVVEFKSIKETEASQTNYRTALQPEYTYKTSATI